MGARWFWLRVQWRQTTEKLWRRLAWLMPRDLVRWCYMRVVAHATTGEYGDTEVPELTVMDAIDRWRA